MLDINIFNVCITDELASSSLPWSSQPRRGMAFSLYGASHLEKTEFWGLFGH
jgi:hypothetical protein